MRDLGTKTYGNIDKARVDTILDALTSSGSVITGRNPWFVDTKNHGVLLKGEWDEAASSLAITVTDADWYVPRSAVWENIDSLMSRVA
jgi:hypothetical protein